MMLRHFPAESLQRYDQSLIMLLIIHSRPWRMFMLAVGGDYGANGDQAGFRPAVHVLNRGIRARARFSFCFSVSFCFSISLCFFFSFPGNGKLLLRATAGENRKLTNAFPGSPSLSGCADRILVCLTLPPSLSLSSLISCVPGPHS